MADPLACELGDHQAVPGEHGRDLLAVGFARRGLAEIDQSLIEDRHLESEVAQIRRPSGHGPQGVERRFIAQELRQEDRGAFDRAHLHTPVVRSRRSLAKV